MERQQDYRSSLVSLLLRLLLPLLVRSFALTVNRETQQFLFIEFKSLINRGRWQPTEQRQHRQAPDMAGMNKSNYPCRSKVRFDARTTVSRKELWHRVRFPLTIIFNLQLLKFQSLFLLANLVFNCGPIFNESEVSMNILQRFFQCE